MKRTVCALPAALIALSLYILITAANKKDIEAIVARFALALN